MADDENLAALAAKGDLPALVARLEKPGTSANYLAECDGMAGRHSPSLPCVGSSSAWTRCS